MAFYKYKIPHTKKPRIAKDVDWSNSINGGLSHYWTLCECGGKVARDIVGGLHGVHDDTRVPKFLRTVDQGSVLDAPAGDPSQLNTTNAPTFDQSFTVEFVVRRYSGTTYGTICSAGSNQGFWTNGSNIVLYTGSIVATVPITNNEWTHIVGVCSPNGTNEDFQFYKNGVAAGSPAINTNISFIPNYFLAHNAENFIGSMAYFKIYGDRSLSAIEAQELYQNSWQSLVPIEKTIFLPEAPSGIILDIKDSTHNHTADNVGLYQIHKLQVKDSTHNHTADGVGLNISGNIIPQDSTHNHTADNVGLNQTHKLQVKDSTHNHTAEIISLKEYQTLQIKDSTHNHTVDNIGFTEGAQVRPQDSTHNHTADNVGLYQTHKLIVEDSIHTHTAENTIITQKHMLHILDSTHRHTAEIITWNPPIPYVPAPERTLNVSPITRMLTKQAQSRVLTA